MSSCHGLAPIEAFLQVVLNQVTIIHLREIGTEMDLGFVRSILISEVIDTVYKDFEKPEADGIFLRMTKNLLRDRPEWRPTEEIQYLEQGLAASKLSIAQVKGSTSVAAFLENSADRTRNLDLKEATELLTKGSLRLSTDKPGAITACTSACESTCRIALERLGLPLPTRKQLPDYLDALCDNTNLMALARVSGEETKRLFGSLRGLARHSYKAAHKLGDRHAQGERATGLTTIGADLAVASCAALATVIAGTIERGELEPVPPR